MNTLVLLAVRLLLAVLFPVAVYLGILGWINRRPRGLLVSGPWDFAGVLFAASGFLFFGGPALLDSVGQLDVWRNLWLPGEDGADQPIEARLTTARALLHLIYFLAVIVSVVLLLLRRRRLTAIYHVDPGLIEMVLGQVFARLGLSFIQTGNVLHIKPDLGMVDVPTTLPVTASEPVVEGLPQATILLEQVTTLEVEASAAMCHVTLWWSPSDSLLRREVEMQLRRALVENLAPDRGVSDWLILLSSTLFFLLLVGAGILVLLRLLK